MERFIYAGAVCCFSILWRAETSRAVQQSDTKTQSEHQSPVHRYRNSELKESVRKRRGACKQIPRGEYLL